MVCVSEEEKWLGVSEQGGSGRRGGHGRQLWLNRLCPCRLWRRISPRFLWSVLKICLNWFFKIPSLCVCVCVFCCGAGRCLQEEKELAKKTLGKFCPKSTLKVLFSEKVAWSVRCFLFCFFHTLKASACSQTFKYYHFLQVDIIVICIKINYNYLWTSSQYVSIFSL